MDRREFIKKSAVAAAGSLLLATPFAYILEGSADGRKWIRCGGHSDVQKRAPHTDVIDKEYRYLRVTITKGIGGIWEWNIVKDK